MIVANESISNMKLAEALVSKLQVTPAYLYGLIGVSERRAIDDLRYNLAVTKTGNRLLVLHETIGLLVSKGIDGAESILNVLQNGRVKVNTGDDDIDSLSLLGYICCHPWIDNLSNKVTEAINEYMNYMDLRAV